MGKRNYKRLCDNIENVENYELAKSDNFVGWDCHHRLETHNSDGERRLVDIESRELKALDMYFHRPAKELIFLTRKEHNYLHNKGKKTSEEAKRKQSEAHKGKHLTEEHKNKISESNKGRKPSEEHKRKLSEVMKGRKPSEVTMKKLSEFCKGKHWKVVDGKRVWY